MSQYSSLFKSATQSSKYVAFRPTYPKELFQEILRFVGSAPKIVAVDVACGSGQLTADLPEYFDKVIGFDVSETQLSEAKKHDKIEYLVGSAESFPVSDNSADLVTVAQAIHWFDLPSFYKEVARVLKPGGTLAVIGYGNTILSNEEASQVVTKFYDGTLKGYWSDRRQLVDNHYRDIYLPYDSTRWDYPMKKTYSLGSFVGYLSSWSAYQTYLKKNPTVPDPLVEVEQKLMKAYGATSVDHEVETSWPLFLMMCKKPTSV